MTRGGPPVPPLRSSPSNQQLPPPPPPSRGVYMYSPHPRACGGAASRCAGVRTHPRPRRRAPRMPRARCDEPRRARRRGCGEGGTSRTPRGRVWGGGMDLTRSGDTCLRAGRGALCACHRSVSPRGGGSAAGVLGKPLDSAGLGLTSSPARPGGDRSFFSVGRDATASALSAAAPYALECSRDGAAHCGRRRGGAPLGERWHGGAAPVAAADAVGYCRHCRHRRRGHRRGAARVPRRTPLTAQTRIDVPPSSHSHTNQKRGPSGERFPRFMHHCTRRGGATKQKKEKPPSPGARSLTVLATQVVWTGGTYYLFIYFFLPDAPRSRPPRSFRPAPCDQPPAATSRRQSR